MNKALSKELMGAHVRPGKYKTLHGLELVDKVIDIDQSPIGRTPRSNPATGSGGHHGTRCVFPFPPREPGAKGGGGLGLF